MLAKYLLKRIALSIPVLFGISVLVFLLVRLVPGDTVTVMLGAQYNEEQAQMMREKYGSTGLSTCSMPCGSPT